MTMYREAYKPGQSSLVVQNKVDTICRLLRDVMDCLDRSKYLDGILTSYIRQGDVQSALKVVQLIYEESVKDGALKFLSVLVNADKLYSEALSTYDVHLTLMVAQRSQKVGRLLAPHSSGASLYLCHLHLGSIFHSWIIRNLISFRRIFRTLRSTWAT